MVQVRSIRKSVWAAVGVAVLLAPFTQKGPRDYLDKKITEARVRSDVAVYEQRMAVAIADPNSITDSNTQEHAAYWIARDPNHEITDKHYKFARDINNIDSNLTYVLVKHKNYTIEDEDIKIYSENLTSKFADGLKKNPGFKN